MANLEFIRKEATQLKLSNEIITTQIFSLPAGSLGSFWATELTSCMKAIQLPLIEQAPPFLQKNIREKIITATKFQMNYLYTTYLTTKCKMGQAILIALIST